MFFIWSCMSVIQYLSQTNLWILFLPFQSMMIEQRRSFAAVKAEAPTRVGMTGPEETANGEATPEALEVLGHGLGLTIQMEM